MMMDDDLDWRESLGFQTSKEQITDLKTDRDRWRDQAERLALTY